MWFGFHFPWSHKRDEQNHADPLANLVKVFEAAGFHTDRIAGSHVIMSKLGVARPVVVPKYAEVGRDIILSNLRTAGISRERYFRLLRAV